MSTFIEARVIQKVDTEANWLSNPLKLYQGEIAFVSDKYNFKLNNTDIPKTFAELDYYYKGDILGSVLPIDDLANKPDGVYRATISGTYSSVVVKEGYYTLLRKKDGVWSLESEVKMPSVDIDGNIVVGQTTKAVNGDKIAQYISNTSFSIFIPAVSAIGYDLDSIVYYNDKLYKSLESDNKTLPTDATKWKEIKLGTEVDQEFDKNSENAISNSAVTPLSEVLYSFLGGEIQEDIILTMPQDGETNGTVLNVGLQEFPVGTGAWGVIPMSKLIGFNKIKISNGLNLLGNDVLWLAKKTSDGTYVNLVTGVHPEGVEIEIDHTAQNYIYSRLSSGSIITQFKLINSNSELIVEKDAVKKYIDKNSGKGSFNIGNIVYPEDYGAEAIKNPKNPDDSLDCTNAFNTMFRDLISRTDFFSWKIVMSGVYRIGGAPIYADSNSQLDITFNSVYEWKLRTFVFEGQTMPTMVDGPLQPLNGSGFYSSYVSTDKTKYKYLLALKGNDNFGLNVGHMLFDRISVYIKGVDYNQDGTTTYVTNEMGGLNLDNLNTAGFTQLYITNTASGMFIPEPTTSLGLALPKSNNTGSIYGDKLLVSGFRTGVVLTEHTSINHLIVVFCKYGVECQQTYPININSANLEMNIVPMVMGDKSCVNIGVFQTEDINDASKWFNRTGNHIKGVGNSRVVLGQVSCHVWGGSSVNLSVDANVKYRYLMDESGNAKLD